MNIIPALKALAIAVLTFQKIVESKPNDALAIRAAADNINRTNELLQASVAELQTTLSIEDAPRSLKSKAKKTKKPTTPPTLAPLKGYVLLDVCSWIQDVLISQTQIDAQRKLAAAQYTKYPLSSSGNEYVMMVYQKVQNGPTWVGIVPDTGEFNGVYLNDKKKPVDIYPRIITSRQFKAANQAKTALRFSGAADKELPEFEIGQVYKVLANGTLELESSMNITKAAVNTNVRGLRNTRST